MRTKLFSMSLVILLLIIMSGCGSDFNTDFDPPPPDTKIKDILPSEINGMKGEIVEANLRPPFVGYSSKYGDGKIVISVINAHSKEVADEYFKFAIVPNFDKMKNHFHGKINGKWKANGTDANGRKWYAWVNNNWVFLLNGSDVYYFKMAINAFKYIEE